MEFQIKLFNNFSTQNSFKVSLLESESKDNLFQSLHDLVRKEFGLCQNDYILLSKNGIKIQSNSIIQNGQEIQICPTVLGGKGGFGSLLRAFGKQMQQSTNREACRDLTGRRIRHVKNEEKLKEFMQNQEEIAREKEEKKQEKIEKKKQKLENMEQSHHLFVDPKYDQQKEKIANDLEEAIGKATAEKKKTTKSTEDTNETTNKADSSNAETKSELTRPSEKGLSSQDINKKARVTKTNDKIYGAWMGCDDLDVSSSDDDDDESEEEKVEPAKKKLKA